MAKPKVPDKYQEPFLFCRTFGHTWKVGETQEETTVFYRFVLLCDVCHTRRLEVINSRTGAPASRRYEYPDGYQATRGEGLRRTSYRIEFIRRIRR